MARGHQPQDLRTHVKENVAIQEIMIRYLLGLLPEGELQKFEAACFRDDSLLEELRATEDELMDDYVNGQLSEQHRRNFERHFLSSDDRRQKLAFAIAMKIYSAKSRSFCSAKASIRGCRWLRGLASLLRR